MAETREITLNAIEQWRAQLPLSDVSGSAKAFYTILQSINKTRLSAVERFEILSVLRPVLSYLSQTLQKFYNEQEILSPSQCLIADLVYALNIEMLKGYKLIATDLKDSVFYNRKVLLSTLQNAMICCVKIIFSAYTQHRNPPAGIWLELHKIFLLAQSKKMATKSLNKVVEWHNRTNTLTDIYKHCLLFAMTNPLRLRQEEMSHLLYAIDAWTPLLNLQTNAGKKSALFVVDMNCDAPPQYVALHFDPLKNYYYLGLDKVNDHLMRLLSFKLNAHKHSEKELSEKFLDAELTLPISIIESLLNAWRHLSDRTHAREKMTSVVKICFGISAASSFISDPNGLKCTTPKSCHKDLHETINMDVLPSPPGQNEAKSGTYECFECEVVDQSQGGLCLKWKSDVTSQLQCGEIIALSKEDEVWEVGTVRWLRHEKDSEVFFGIQFLGSKGIGVKARLADAETLQSIPTLLFPGQKETGKAITLITPLLPFKQGNELELEYSGNTYGVKLLRSFNPSPSYQEFEIEFLGEAILFPSQSHSSIDPSQLSA